MGITAFRMKSPNTLLLDSASRLLRQLPAEKGHRFAVQMLRATGPLLPRPPRDDPRLEVDAMGLIFPNPVGLAAGFDKDAEVPNRMLKLGFGFAECGTLTPRAQPGNPKPRIFRLIEDEAVINRLGFNNHGMMRAARRLKKRRGRGIVGINIGANKDSADMIADYMAAFLCLAPYASYMAVNVSSPNTPGLRGLQDREHLETLLTGLLDIRAKARSSAPILLKIAPDLDDGALDDIAAVALHAGIEGMIVSNTTVTRPDSLRSPLKAEKGGLSGPPVFGLTTETLKKMRRRTEGRLTLVGVGGIRSGADAYAKIRAGASLVQLYTALTYHGPGLVTRIKRELVQLLERDGFTNVTQAVGVDVDK
jgi:dihydroorotate dehydrogenase